MEDPDTLSFEQLLWITKVTPLAPQVRLIPYLWGMSDILSLQSGETEGFVWKQVNMANPGSVLKIFIQYL